MRRCWRAIAPSLLVWMILPGCAVLPALSGAPRDSAAVTQPLFCLEAKPIAAWLGEPADSAEDRARLRDHVARWLDTFDPTDANWAEAGRATLGDSSETLAQINAHNEVGRALCGWAALKKD